MSRIILLNQYYAPDEAATAQMLSDLGEGLAASGSDVVAICSDRSYAEPSRRYARQEVIRGVSIRRVRSTGFGRASRVGRICDYATFLLGATLRLLTTPRPDVVISLSTPPMLALVGTLCARLRGARAVFWSMDVYPDVAYELGVVRKGSLAGRLLAYLAYLTHRLPDTVVALGETMAEKLEANGVRNITVIHNWADGDAIQPMPVEENRLRREWGWNDRFVIMYSGNMGLAHEFETALAGMHQLDRAKREEPTTDSIEVARGSNDIDRSLVLAAFLGSGPRLPEIRDRITGLALTNVQVRPSVARSELADSLTAADVQLVTMRDGVAGLIVPSKIYGILAAGRPTIYVGPAEGEVYEILTSGRCGIHVPTGDIGAFVEAVALYLEQPELRDDHGRSARALYQKLFTRDRALQEFRLLLRV